MENIDALLQTRTSVLHVSVHVITAFNKKMEPIIAAIISELCVCVVSMRREVSPGPRVYNLLECISVARWGVSTGDLSIDNRQ